MKKYIIILITALMSLSFSLGVAAENKKLAQTGFQFLSVVSDARAAAMAEAMTSLETGSSALFFNPAGMANMTGMVDIAASDNQWIADIRHNAFSLALSPANGEYGVIGFSVVVVTGVLAVARVRLPRWYWVGLMTGTALAAAFVHWLIFETLYRIGALCPYCMVVWSMTIPLLVVVASIALRPLAGNSAARVLYHWRWPLVALWFTAVLLMILVRFWDYWSTLL